MDGRGLGLLLERRYPHAAFVACDWLAFGKEKAPREARLELLANAAGQPADRGGFWSQALTLDDCLQPLPFQPIANPLLR